jgi:hypothetical protein
MEYELRHPKTEAEAIEIIESALHVIYGQIEHYRGERKKAWNGDYVTHLRKEAQHAIDWIRQSHFTSCA